LPLVAIFIQTTFDVVETTGCDVSATLPSVRYLGMGYDIIKGNPDNDYKDPGFLFSVLGFTWENCDTTSDRRYRVPDHVQALQLKSCGYQCTVAEITGVKSYQKSLSYEVSVALSIPIPTTPAAVDFSGSGGYREMKAKTSRDHRQFTSARAKCVEYEIAVNYLDSLIKVSDDFRRAFETLPLSDDNKGMIAYGRFITTYGTHFTSSVTLGAKMVIHSEFTQTAWSEMKSNGTDIGFGTALSMRKVSVGVDTETSSDRKLRTDFESKRSSHTKHYRGIPPPADGKWETWARLTGNAPAPISYALVPIIYLIDKRFFPGISDYNLTTRRTLLSEAIKSYCFAVPGCEVPELDPVTMNMINATSNFRRSPSRVSCPPNSRLLSCGIKNIIQDTDEAVCDSKRYAIPVSKTACECSDQYGAKCLSWCTFIDMKFEIVESLVVNGTANVLCSRDYKVLK